MKRMVSILVIVVMLFSSLSACSFNLDLTAKAEPYIQEMMAALAAEDMDAAKALLHPDCLDDYTDEGLSALAQLLDGRTAQEYVQVNLNVNSRTGTGGASRTESGTVHITFEDWTGLRLSYIYFEDKDGQGFLEFQVMVGV